MNCPIDNTPLAITERQGIEIDYCPKCRGVWLDRGELDKLIERNAQYGASGGYSDEEEFQPGVPGQQAYAPNPAYPAPPSPQGVPTPYNPNQPNVPPGQNRPAGPDIAGIAMDLINKGLEKRRHSSHHGGYDGRKKKKGGLLGELFDF